MIDFFPDLKCSRDSRFWCTNVMVGTSGKVISILINFCIALDETIAYSIPPLDNAFRSGVVVDIRVSQTVT